MTKIKAGIGKHPDEMSFDECMSHVRRVLFWDSIDGQWTDIDFLKSAKWDRLAGYITSAHARGLESLRAENAKLRECAADLLKRMRRQEHEWGLDVMVAESLSPSLLYKLRELGIEVGE